MAFSFQPKVIGLDGLVLYLDASNVKSYVSGSTNWSSLYNQQGSGSLVNGPTYIGENGGTIIFDGTNDLVNFSAPNLGSTATVEMWVKQDSFSTGGMMFGWSTYDVYVLNGYLGYNTFNSDVYGPTEQTITNLGIAGKWAHYVFEMRTDVSYINNKIYINAVSQTLTQLLGTQNASNRTFNSGNGRISGALFVNYPNPMTCSMFKVYNRALTQSEITQNYNTLKGRFGIT